jgi:hypothetical protein
LSTIPIPEPVNSAQWIRSARKEKHQKNRQNNEEMERNQVMFNGYVPAESVIKYLQDFEYLAAIKLLTLPQQRALIAASLQGPARAAYEAAVAIGAAGGGIEGNTDDLFVASAKNWLRRIYHTQEIQNGIRDQISNMYQESNEDPVTFHTRILHALSMAEYPQAVMA